MCCTRNAGLASRHRVDVLYPMRWAHVVTYNARITTTCTQSLTSLLKNSSRVCTSLSTVSTRQLMLYVVTLDNIGRCCDCRCWGPKRQRLDICRVPIDGRKGWGAHRVPSCIALRQALSVTCSTEMWTLYVFSKFNDLIIGSLNFSNIGSGIWIQCHLRGGEIGFNDSFQT